MTKTVFSSAEQTIHVWAQQNQLSGRSSNVWFDNEVLYSYDTPIATFITRKRNKKKPIKAILISNVKYSVTTSSHRADVWRSIDESKYQVIHCEDLGIRPDRQNFHRNCPTIGNMHENNIRAYTRDYAITIEKLSYARSSGNITWYIKQCELIKAQAQKYCNLFGLRFKSSQFKVIPESILNPALTRAARWDINVKKQEEIEHKARKVKVVAQANAYLQDENLKLPYDWDILLDEELKEKVRFKRNKDLAYKRLVWLNGANVHETYFLFDYIALRVNHTKKVIQTSHGAEFPIDHAIKAFPLIKACKERHLTWKRNGHSIHLGHFQIDEVSENGTVKAGCHTVLYSEIERIAKKLGLENDNTNSNSGNSNNNGLNF